MLDQIRPWLYISGFRETRDLPLLQSVHIGAMLQLAREAKQPGIASLYLPVEDGEALPLESLKKGVEFIRTQKAAGQTVLVACGAGVSRSTTFAVAALKEEENSTLAEAFSQVYLSHPDAFPHSVLWRALRQYYDHRDLSLVDAAREIEDIREDVRPKL
jgi:protein-tyrosine phosphatase